MSAHKTKLVAILIGGLAAVLAAAALGGRSDDGGGASAAASGIPNPTPKAALAAFGVLRNSASASADQVPVSLAHQPQAFGIENASARRARTGQPGESVWVVPGSGGVCLSRDGQGPAASGICGDWEMAMNGEVMGTVSDGPTRLPGETVLQGLLPDGIPAVTVTLDDGTTRAMQVSDNVYAVSLDGLPVGLTWSDGRTLHEKSLR